MLDLLADELLLLDRGVTTHDADSKSDFNLRARLLYTMGDYPGELRVHTPVPLAIVDF
jgi:hypothetical protein